MIPRLSIQDTKSGNMPDFHQDQAHTGGIKIVMAIHFSALSFFRKDLYFFGIFFIRKSSSKVPTPEPPTVLGWPHPPTVAA